MKTQIKRQFLLAWLACCLSACASIPDKLVSAPRVELRSVQVIGLGFKSQTFLMSFDVANPNPFPLPVRNVGYGVKLNGQHFASGETASEFTVPAGGDTQFAISVDLNLLQTAPQLLSIVRAGVHQDIRYELEGRLAIDIPLIPSLQYRNSGTIRFYSRAK